MHHFFLILLHYRTAVYVLCSILFTVGTIAFGFQPYFEESYSKNACLLAMFFSIAIGLSYTAIIKHYAPHKKLH